MQKINFQDLPSTTTPINASNLNQIQDNMEGAFKNSYSTSEDDGYSCDYINGLKPTVLWTNSSPTSSFAAQNVSLSDFYSYSYYEVLYIGDLNSNKILSTGKIPISNLGMLQFLNGKMVTRNISDKSSSMLRFGGGNEYNSYGGEITSNNNICIPYQILGYK